MRQQTHRIVVMRRNGVTRLSDGRWSPAEIRTPVMGHATLGNLAEIQRASTRGLIFDAVARVPLGTAVAEKDRVELSGINPHLDGVYNVTGVRYAKKALRVLLQKDT